MFQAFRIELLVLIYYTFNGNLRYLFNIFRETSVNTNTVPRPVSGHQTVFSLYLAFKDAVMRKTFTFCRYIRL